MDNIRPVGSKHFSGEASQWPKPLCHLLDLQFTPHFQSTRQECRNLVTRKSESSESVATERARFARSARRQSETGEL